MFPSQNRLASLKLSGANPLKEGVDLIAQCLRLTGKVVSLIEHVHSRLARLPCGIMNICNVIRHIGGTACGLLDVSGNL
jgi:hypothetical protein